MGEWDNYKIGDMAKGIRGVSYKPGNLKLIAEDSDCILLRANNIQEGRLNKDDIQILPMRLVSEEQIARNGDIAVCMSNGSKKLVGKSAVFDFDDAIYTVGAFCSLFRPLSNCDRRFVSYIFQSNTYQHSIDGIVSGSAINNLNNGIIENISIKAPADTAEQSRIAAVLTATDDAIAASRAMVEKYAAIKQGLMQDLLTKGTPTRLAQIGTIMVSSVDKHIRQGEIPVRLCNYTDVYNNRYITDNLPFSRGSVTKSELRRFTLRDGDVIFTKDSETPDDIGIPTVIIGNPDGLVCGYHLAILRPYKEQYDGRFVMLALQTQACVNYFGAMANGITRFGMTIGTLENQRILVPDTIEEQRHIADILIAADERLTAERERLAKLENIKRGLMDDLLTNRVSTDNLKGGREYA